jgi:hypothetical protein
MVAGDVEGPDNLAYGLAFLDEVLVAAIKSAGYDYR